MKAIKIAVVTILFFTLGVGIFLVFNRWVLNPETLTNDSDLPSLDQLLLKNDYQKATEFLLAQASEQRSTQDWNTLIKRSKQLFEESGNWKPYLKISKNAFTQFSGNEELTAFYVWGLLRNGFFEQAQTIALKYLNAPLFRDLRQEALLSYGILQSENEKDPFQSLLKKLDSPMHLELYETLLNLTNEEGIRINYLLLLLKNGQFQIAQGFLKRIPISQNIKSLLPWVYFDMGLWNQSLELLEELSIEERYQYLTLLSDLYYLLGRWTEARVLNEAILSSSVENKIPALFNLASYWLEVDNFVRSLEIVAQGLEIYPNNKELEMYRFQILLKEGLDNQTYSKLLEMARIDTDYEILFYKINQQNLSIPRLWELFQKGRNNSSLIELLTWTLLSSGDEVGALRALKGFESEDRITWWSKFYSSLAYTFTGKYEQAKESLQEAMARRRDYTFFYNLGLIQLHISSQEDNWKLAYSDFSKALEMIPPQKQIHRSLVLLQMGRISYLLGDHTLAKSELRQAYLLDNSNLKASLLLKSLETK